MEKKVEKLIVVTTIIQETRVRSLDGPPLTGGEPLPQQQISTLTGRTFRYILGLYPGLYCTMIFKYNVLGLLYPFHSYRVY